MYTPFQERVRILSIDPGTTLMGIAVTDYGLDSGTINVIHAATLTRKAVLGNYSRPGARIGDRESVMQAYGEEFSRYLEDWEPTVVCSEAPFSGSFPTAYQVLSEVVYELSIRTMRWDDLVNFYRVSPTEVKRHMGVHGNSSVKGLMRDAVLRRTDVTYPSYVDTLGPDAIDAICVGMWGVDKYRAANIGVL